MSDNKQFGPVSVHTGEKTGWRFANCAANDGFHIFGPHAPSIDSDAYNHAHDVHDWVADECS